MSGAERDDLRARMKGLLDRELVERALARAASNAPAPEARKPEAPQEVTVAEQLAADVCRIAAAALGLSEEDLDPRENLANLGIDSIAITEVMVQISRHFGISVAPTTFFEARHLDDLGAILLSRFEKAIRARYEVQKDNEPAQQASREAAPAATATAVDQKREQGWMRRHRAAAARPPAAAKSEVHPAMSEGGPVQDPQAEALLNTSPEAAPIAILAMEGRFPKSPDLAAFEAHLAAGDDCIEEVPPERWDWRAVFGDPKKGAFTDVKFGGFVPEADRFDAAFFNISPREAELMDPQHRLFMECVWNLIERGGYAPGALSGRKVGLFLGINLLDYTDMVNRAGIMKAQQLTGLGHAFCPNRLSFLLDIHGPSEVIDTACSSSLVAIHRGVMSIRHEGCEMAIAGGSNLMLSPTQHVMFSKVGMIAPDGRCKTFSKNANGYARADGVGAVLLKRLDLAERDGDPILGVIRGSVEHHGGGATSLTAPNPRAQARLIVEAHRQAGTDPRTIGMIECHGTGTPLGDPIEIEGLKLAFTELYRDRDLALPASPGTGLGSVKSNIGHAETAAGVAGLIKVLLAMSTGTLYRTLHCEEPNPLLELDGSPFHLLQAARPWQRPVLDGVEQPRRAGLSSFGAGGANVHLVIEEYRGAEGAEGRRGAPVGLPLVVPVSATSETGLREAVARLLEAVGEADLGEVAFTLQTGRDALKVRAAFVVDDPRDLDARMAAFLAGEADAAVTGSKPQGRKARTELLDPAGRDVDDIARHWAAGGDVDWRASWGPQTPRRITLPGTPFQRRRFWLPEPAAGLSAEHPPARKPGPLVPRAEGGGRYGLTLTGHEVFLADHRVAGTPVLPGVAYLELVRGAAELDGFKAPSLRKTVFLAPLRVETETRVTCAILRQDDGGARAEVSSLAPDGTRIVHAQMRVDHASPTPATVDLAALGAVHGKALDRQAVYAAFDAMGLVYGPGHRVIRDLALPEGPPPATSVLARIVLPDQVSASLGDYVLHPSLMDGALQAAIGLALDADGRAPQTAALPFSIDTVEVLGACEIDMWAHVRAGEATGAGLRRMDVDLIAADGTLRVALRGFVTRELDPAAPAERGGELLRFEPVWRPLETALESTPRDRKIVLLDADTCAGADLSANFTECLPDHQVVVLEGASDEALDRRFTRLARQLMETARAALSAGTVRIQLVLSGGEEAAPLSGLVGMLRSISREYPKVGGQVLIAGKNILPADLADLLRAAARAPDGAKLRAGVSGLELEAWQETPAGTDPGELPWRKDGVYLVTGGSGPLGQAVAGDILERAPGATVILASRNAPDQTLAQRLGVTSGLHHMHLDVADADAVASCLRDIRQAHGTLHGVVHAAGVLKDAAFAAKTAAELEAVLAPKVSGLVALDRAIGAGDLDFLAVFSSISGVVGSAGQADYAAANGFLDGFAELREDRRRAGQCHGRTVSLAWPLWRGGGMTLAPAQVDAMRRTTGLVPLETDTGLEVLRSVLCGPAARVLVTAGEPARIRAFIEAVFAPPAAETSTPRPDKGTDTTRPTPADLARRILLRLTEAAGEQLKVSTEDLDPDVELTEYGFDSIGFTQFANALNDLFALELTPTLFFEHPTLEGLAAHLAEEEAEAMTAVLGSGVPGPGSVAAEMSAQTAARAGAEPPPALLASPAVTQRPVTTPAADTPIAIIGMSGRFPGAPDVDAFWDLLKDGRDAISEVPAERWDWRAYWGDPLREPGKGNVKWGGFIDSLGAFDAGFFGVPAPEARMMDPQQRLLLTEAWRVMEDAGYAPSALAGSDTGVFIGTADTGYSRLIAEAGTPVEGYAMTGLAPSLGPNRISYQYDFHGPSVAVETACSSALIAVHRAVEALRSGQCSAALAGGINALLLPEAFVGFSKAGMLSPEGRCKPFSARADGYARGEGIGLVMLKPLEAAERDGDRILALIRGSAENHGGHAASLTAPNPRAQAALLRTAYRRAGIDARTVGYIEAHGTGTPLGDPIEIEALTAAFADLTRDAETDFGPAAAQSCAVGSVKSNIGHLELAAGIAGLIKVIQQMRHGEIARSLHCDDLNPYLKLDGSPFHIARTAETWARPRDASGAEAPRRAGVSSFGFGGTNAHVVLEEYRPRQELSAPQGMTGTPELIVLSARTEEQLRQMADRLKAFLSEGDAALADIACTLQTARAAMEHRLAFSAASRAQLRERLDAFLAGAPNGLQTGTVKAGRKAISVLESDGPLREAAAGLAERGRGEDLLSLWVSGFAVDWHAMRRGRPGRRIALPGYPFAQTRYWVGEGAAASAAVIRQREPEASLTVDGSESFLRDHRVNGSPVLPGVMSFELLRQALKTRGAGNTNFELVGHTWTGSVPVGDRPVALRVSLTDGAAGDCRYEISADDGRSTWRHAEGTLRRGSEIPADLDLGAARAAASSPLDIHDLYARFEALGLDYGPAQRAITGLWKGAETVLARLELPGQSDGGLDIHPALVDGSLQALLAFSDGSEAPALPYAVRRVQVAGATTATMWALLRSGERGAAIDLADETGRVIVRLEDFATRPLAPAGSAAEPEPGVATAVGADERAGRALALVTDIAARTLEVDPASLDIDAELGDFGFDSVSMTVFASRMNAELGLSLTPADFFEFATIERLADHVAGDLSDAVLGVSEAAPAQASAEQVSGDSRFDRPPTAAETGAISASEPSGTNHEPIAIVGHSCCFPMAPDAEAFWDNLVSGRDCITRIPEDRWSWQALDGDPREDPTRTNIHWGGFIDGVYAFDPLFFGISPREARLMDPQQRLMLLHAWKAIEDAGHDPMSLAGQKVGVFVGTSSSGYREMIGADSGNEGYVATGSVPSVGPNRISYFLDLHGPSEPVETACSSSLVALHRAVQAIRAGDCDMALIGGVNTILTPEAHISFAKAGMLSPDGRCKTFSAEANGYVRGEGAGMLFLRRLTDAERDGDPVLALVRGTAINHGGRANSLTAPNTAAQAELLTTAWRAADIDPRSLGYIEAHGTGTALGDPVEINALKSALRALPRSGGQIETPACYLGSVKTNIGHLELAAGVAGVIKVLKQIQHRRLAPSLHCDTVNPYIDLGDSPFEILREPRDWQPVREADGSSLPLRAGISSFGFGGVNAHAVLEEYRPAETPHAPAPARGPVIAVLSARGPERLREMASALKTRLDQGDLTDGDLTDLAFTLQVGRAAFSERLAIVAAGINDVRTGLEAFLAKEASATLFTGSAEEGVPAPADGTSPEELAASWVRGGDIDWARLRDGPRRRLRLPTYPFAHDVYRAGRQPAPAVGAVAAESVDADDRSRILLDPDAFYLKDHLVRGRRILPGAMAIELVCRAAREDGLALPLELRDLTWRHPVDTTDAAVALRVAFKEQSPGGLVFALLPASAEAPVFARGQMSSAPASASPSRIDLDALQASMTGSHDPDWLYACYSALGIAYGPSFRAVRELHSADGAVIARLVLPDAAVADDDFLLHPSLLDAAFHAALVAFGEDEGSKLALPFGLDRLQLWRPTARTMWAHLRARPSGAGIRKLDIDLIDADGVPAARIEGFTLRLLPDPPGVPGPDRPGKDAEDSGAVERFFIDLIARETEIAASAILLKTPFEAYGIDSVLIMRLTGVLEKSFGSLPKTLFFEYQTLEELIAYFRVQHPEGIARIVGQDKTAPRDALPTLAAAAAPDIRREGPENEPIAIIGVAGRYPGARTLNDFWRNLAEGRDCITEIPEGRWDHSRYFDPERRPGKTASKWGGFIDGHDRFDPMFFNIAPREADYMDPQERLFLQCAWEVLENAGHTRRSLAPDGDVGVFVGVMWEEYQLYGAQMSVDGPPVALSGSAASIANRVSYFLNFQGPSLALDTMCSSSLTALHLACEALRSGDCRAALAGGVNLTTHPNKYIALSQGRFLSSKGRCESFGEGGDGYVPAEGVGAVLLKTLSQAEKDGDRIEAVVLGTALNHGGKTNGYTVPNPSAQTAVIEKAMARAGVTPDEISYLEAHGTGTRLGDPIEIAALARAYGRQGADRAPCAIGSVKSNIGHAESAAGIAGLTKILLQLKHGKLVPSLHSSRLNPDIAFEATPFQVQQQLEDWPARSRRSGEDRRIAGLSSFGAGGSNAHVILAEYPASAPLPAGISGPEIYPFSARDPERLRALVAAFRSRLDTLTEADLPALACTLQEGREAFEERLAILADTKADLAAGLDGVLAGSPAPDNVFSGRAAPGAVLREDTAGLADVAAAWTGGAQVDWAARRTGPKQRPLDLPTYPFAEDLCWLPEIPTGPAVSDAPARERAAPLPLLFAPDWRERPAGTGEGPPAGERLHVLCGIAPLYPALALDLKKTGAEVVVLDAPGGGACEAYASHALRLFALLKDLARKGNSKHVQVVVPFAGENIMLEGLSGLLRSAALEQPKLACQIVGVGASVGGLAVRLGQDIASAREEPEVRHSQGRRQVRAWRELTDVAPGRSWKEGGAYLLTGGAGGIGLLVAEDIAASGCRPSLWLTGRSALSPETARRLRRLEGLGARVTYRRVDVTDPAALAELVAEIEAADGGLTGVFHGAGLTRDGLLATKSEDSFSEVLDPKVAGTLALDAALGDRSLDFLVLFASASGALGNPGQTDYAAANGFLDSFAAWRNTQAGTGRKSGRTIAIDWPYWRDGGMRMDARAVDAMERAAGVSPLETAPALAALRAIPATGEDQILVLDGDHDRLRRMMLPGGTAVPRPAAAATGDTRKSVSETGPLPEPAPQPVKAGEAREEVIASIRKAFSAVLGIPAERLGADETVDRFGVDSVSALEIVEALEETFGPLPQTILFEVQTIGRLADALAGRGDTARAAPVPRAAALPDTTGAADTTPAAAPFREPLDRDIAIIAVAGRYPGADTIEDFAELLRAGRDCVTEIPEDRRDLVPVFSERKGAPGASHCKWGAFLGDIDRFDAGFFGYSARAADLADPQERLFLETAWHLFERAGHTRAHLAERYGRSVGVFVGAMYNQYPALATDPDDRALLSLSSYSAIANRVSFFFDLQGPSLAVDSMCSSGLQAVHQACQSLHLGECRLAVAGGVNLSIHPSKYEGLSRAGLAAASADSRAFAGGDGYLPAEGVGAVLLKPLRDAVSDGDRVLGVIRGSLANHAGHSAGYAVPSAEAQKDLLARSFRDAGIAPATIGYVEAAATGSRIGDAIELSALSALFVMPEDGGPGVPLGSVKTNLGHAEAASGMAQLTKVLLQLERRELFPSFVTGAAPQVFEGTPFHPQMALAPWTPKASADGRAMPLRAAVSSFGAGGSNVHLLIEEAPRSGSPSGDIRPGETLLFPLSARSGAQLDSMRGRLAAFLRKPGPVDLAAVSRTLRFGREVFEHRVLFAASTREELIGKLEDLSLAGDPEVVRDTADHETGAMVVLPGYPFARERHWLKRSGPSAPPGKPASARQAHSPVAPVTPAAAPAPSGAPVVSLRTLIRTTLAGELGTVPEEIDETAEFATLGIDSMARMRLAYAVEDATGHGLTPADFAAHPTLADLAAFLEALAQPDADQRDPDLIATGADAGRTFPLGEAQKGLWVFQSLHPNADDYNVPLAFRCRSVDVAALNKALDWLVDAYPLLAMRVETAGEDQDLIMAPRAEQVRLSSLSAPKELETDVFLRQRAAAPFDLGEGVFRAEHVGGGKLDQNESVVLLVAHHIVTDGVSSEILTRDFWRAYGHFSSGSALALPVAADYRVFVAWEADLMGSGAGAAQRDYWLERLSAPLPVLDLALGAVSPEEPGRGDAQLRLPKLLGDALRQLARSGGTSVAALHLTAFAALLHRYSGQDDLVIGVPTLRRPARRFAETLGYCANVIALRLAARPEQSLSEFAWHVSEELREGLAHGDYPFAALARALGGTATGRPPYDVTFAYQSFGADLAADEVFANGSVSLMPEIRQPGDAMLGLEVREDAEDTLVVATWNGHGLCRDTVERMLAHYSQLLEGLTTCPDEPLRSVPMLTGPEHERALHHWSRSGRAEVSGRPVHEQILARARRTPTATAITGETGETSYRGLVARGGRIAQVLRKRGIRRGDRVAVLLGREADAVAALLAVFSLGAVWVPLDPECPRDRLEHILKDAGVSAVLTRKSLLKDLPETAARAIDIGTEGSGVLGRFARPPQVRLRPEDPAYMIYTSGSTGRPKGVVISHGALSGHCEVIAREYGLNARDAVLQFAPASVDTAIEQILPTLIAGARLQMRPEVLPAPGAFRSFLADKGVTVADLPPAYLGELLRAWEDGAGEAGLPSLRLLIVGGEALTTELVTLWSRSSLKDRRLVNAYGPTEATVTALTHTVRPAARERSIPIGRPLPGTEIHILDRAGQMVPDGVIGELHLGGERLALGYHERPGLTEEKFRLHEIGGRTLRLYATGDLACFRPNSGGVVEFHGRRDDQVKLRGHRIELGEIEAAIAACGIAEVAVLLEANRAGDKVLTAYLGGEGMTVSDADLGRRLAETLPAHMVPAIWVRFDRLQKTLSGKIDRTALEWRQTQDVPAPAAVSAPRDPVESTLFGIWTQVLGRAGDDSTLGIGDGFAAAGGHSLLSVRLLGRIEQVFGITLSVSDLAGADTIRAQARLLRQRGVGDVRQEPGPDRSSLLVPLRGAGTGASAPLFLIHPVAGSLGCYRQMVEGLATDVPVLGVRACGLEPGEPLASGGVEELATSYLTRIREHRPDGPYRLCGWSFGGLVAYEIARQLATQGAEVSSLILIDSYLPQDVLRFETASGTAGDSERTRVLRGFFRDLFGAEPDLSANPDPFVIARGLPGFGKVVPGADEESFRRLLSVYLDNHSRLVRYRPQKSPVPMTLVRALRGIDGDCADGWRSLCEARLEVVPSDTDHTSVVERPGLNDWLPVMGRILSGTAT